MNYTIVIRLLTIISKSLNLEAYISVTDKSMIDGNCHHYSHYVSIGFRDIQIVSIGGRIWFTQSLRNDDDDDNNNDKLNRAV